MKIIRLILLVMLVLNLNCSNNNINNDKCLTNNTFNIKQNDVQNIKNDDLLFLKNILSNDSTKIVMLGEQTHYDGTTFEAKTKIIKFLHEEMGYNVLAFESGFFDCTKAWSDIKENKIDVESGMKLSIQDMWSRSVQFQSIIKYIQSTINTDNPLILTGIDPQLTQSYSKMYLIKEFEKIDIINDTVKLNNFKRIVTNLYYDNYSNKEIKIDTTTYISDILLLDEILTNLSINVNKTDSLNNFQYWALIIKGIKESYKSLYFRINSLNSFDFLNVRDSIMANNLIWIHTKLHKNSKIIIWTANFHLLRNYSSLEIEGLNGEIRNKTKTMGDILFNVYKKNLYTIAFISNNNKGITGIFNKSSIENEAFDEKSEFGFIDLKEISKSKDCGDNNFRACVLGTNIIEGKLWQNLDGLFYIKNQATSNF